MANNEWHYTDQNDQDVGPVDFSVMQTNFQNKVIGDNTFIWHPTKCPQWTLLKDAKIYSSCYE